MREKSKFSMKLCAAIVVISQTGGNAIPVFAQNGESPRIANAASYVTGLPAPSKETASELRDLVDRYSSDLGGLRRRYSVEDSPARREVLRGFYSAWQTKLESVDFSSLGQDGKIDYILLKNRLKQELVLLAREEKEWKEMAELLPFAGTIIEFQEARRRMDTLEPSAAAAKLAALFESVDKTRKAVEAGARPDPRPGARQESPPTDAPKQEVINTTKVIGLRASQTLNSLRGQLENWYRYYSGYDPLFTWWNSNPYKKADDAIRAYIKVLRERVVGFKEGEDDPIVGDPIGRDAVVNDLAYEMIAYAPEELIALAEKELAWCEAEMKKAAQEMGLGDDWKAALERTKKSHVEPGKQPDLIRDLAWEAVEYVEKNDLVTVPPLAKDIWRMEMMTPERQKESPFFLGGEVIQVSYPTDTMTQEDKLMSMRGNNRHFARATVHHELIPGHHLQGFMTERYNSHRRAFATSFWGEGWAFYFEMLFWRMGFPRTPEDKMGMLFWRAHRAARIIFSLSFHLGKMTPQECVDLLVNRVGHERANATAEVRRSFGGNYGPLYQVAYMLGALQFWGLHHELVDSGKMTNREFHDRILQGGRIPVEMVRASLTNEALTRDYKAKWKFYGEIPRAPK
jgi:uncharacterized protein (DUF885 family)